MLRQAKFHLDGSIKTEKVQAYTAVLDMLFHISSFSKVLIASDPLEIIGSEYERSALVELKYVVISMVNGSSSESVSLQQFFSKLSLCNFSDFGKSDSVDILAAWDDIVKLIMLVIPPLREVFLGHLESAQDLPGWQNLSSRCFRAMFSSSLHSLEDLMRHCCKVYMSPQSLSFGLSKNAENVIHSNVMVLRRCPEVLIVSVESSYLRPGSQLCFVNGDKAPSVISFPDSFDINSVNPMGTVSESSDEEDEGSRFYDLTAVAACEGASLSTMQAFFRLQNANGSGQDRWYRGAGAQLEEVPKSRVLEGTFLSSSQAPDKRVHPRLLVYMRRDLPQMLDRTIQLVTKGGQMRALGDVAFALAMTTTDNYSEARRCYEEAISLDESLKEVLQDNLLSLDKLEWTQKARGLEEQGDLALANGRYREASDQYSKSLMSAVFGSPEFVRVKEKADLVARIIALESSCHFAERGEEALKSNSYSVAKDHFAHAMRLNPDLMHVQLLQAGIEKTIQSQIVKTKTQEANQAMKAFKYRQAHQLLMEAISIAPEERVSLQSILDELAPLMQCENAFARQRAGLAAVEEKRFSVAVTLFTEAMSLLPSEASSDHANVLCDRALAHFELKDTDSCLLDCMEALKLKPDLGIAHLRLGAAHFALEAYDDASSCYDKALRLDPSLQEQVKTKLRQLTTAKEVQQRKDRELERTRAAEEQKRVLEEKRIRDEQARKEKADKLALEQAERIERNRIKEEEKRVKTLKEKETQEELNRQKEAEKERQRIEKIERDAQKAAEREKLRLEKEREKERQKLEKERKLVEAQKAKEEEQKRQIEAAAERDRLTKEREEARLKKEEEDRLREEEEEKEKKRRAAEKKIELEARRKQREEEEAAAKAAALIAAQAADAEASKIALEKVDIPIEKYATVASASNGDNKPNAAKLQDVQKKAVKAVKTGPVPVSKNVPAWTSEVSGGPAKIESQQDFPPLFGSSGAPVASSTSSSIPLPFNAVAAGKLSISTPSSQPMSAMEPHSFSTSSNTDFSHSMGIDLGLSQQSSLSNTSSSSLFQGDDVLGSLSAYLNEASNNSMFSGSVFGDLSSSAPHGSSSQVDSQSTLMRTNSSGFDILGEATSSLSLGQRSFNGNGASQGGAGFGSLKDLQAGLQPVNDLSYLYPKGSQDMEFQPSPELLHLAESRRQAMQSGSTRTKPSNSTAYFGLSGFDSQQLSGGLAGLGMSSSSSSQQQQAMGLGQTKLPANATIGYNRDKVSKVNTSSSIGSSDLLGNRGADAYGSNMFGSHGSGSFNDGGMLGGFKNLNLGSSALLDDSSGLYGGLSGTDNKSFSDDDPVMRALGALSHVDQPFSSPDRLGGSFNSSSNVFGTGSSSLSFGQAAPTNPWGKNDGLLGVATPSSPSAGKSSLSRSSTASLPASGIQRSLGDSGSFPLGLGTGGGQSGQQQASLFGNNFNASGNNLNPQSFRQSGLGTLGRSVMGTDLQGGQSQVGGIDSDVVLDNTFPSVSWLRGYDMHMYRWAGDTQDWTEFAMHIPPHIEQHLFGLNKTNISEIQHRSGCAMRVEAEMLRGRSETFLVFTRGPIGHPSNLSMASALELISNLLSQPVAQQILNGSTNLSNSGFSSLGGGLSGNGIPNDFSASLMSLSSQLPIQSPVQRLIDVPVEAATLLSSKLAEVSVQSGAKILLKGLKPDGRMCCFELNGSAESVDRGMQLVWDVIRFSQQHNFTA